jgi:hypothetical protein
VGSGLISPLASIGYHQYRDKPSQPHDGFATRAAEIAALREIAQGRQIAMTETGYSDGLPKRSAWPCSWFAKGRTEDQVAEYLRAEIEFAGQVGAECCVTYQLNDGAGPNEHFGIRRRDGSLKPAAYAAMRA